MVRRWRLKLICIGALLLIAALSNQINLTFNSTLNQSIQQRARHHLNKLKYVEEFSVHDKALKFGLSHSEVVNQSKYKQSHLSRKRDGDEVERGNRGKHGGKDTFNHKFELTQVMLNDVVSSLDLDILPLKLKLDCLVNKNGGYSRLEDGVLKICISTSVLMKEFDAMGLSKAHLKLLVLKYILNELGSDNVNALLLTNVETEEFNRYNITTVVTDLLSLKLAEMNDQLERENIMKDPNPTHSVGSLSLGNIVPSQPAPAHHLPSPALISQKVLSNSTQGNKAVHNKAGQNKNEQWSHKVQEHHSQKVGHLTKSLEFADHTARTKIQDIQTSHSNFKIFNPKRGEQVHSVLLNIPKLEGFVIKGNKSLLEKGFPTDYSFDSPELLQRRKYITAALEEASELQRNIARVSLNTNLLERGKHQHEKIQRYCKSENMSASLPENFMELNTLFKHLLYDDSKKIVFCYVPKNSCSSMKRMMLILNGIIPANSSQGSRPSESMLGLVHSFRNLSREGAIYRLENYFKFSILRNPMERLLSAYRNKLEKPLDYKRVKKFPDRLKAFILTLKKKSDLQKWVSLKNYSNDIHPSFSDTLDFMTEFTLSAYNEHFLPFLTLCHPCAVKYDLILNLKSMNYDIFALMEYMSIPFQYYPGVFKSSLTRKLLEDYYQQVPQKVKSRVFNTLAKELDFYNGIYPEEL